MANIGPWVTSATNATITVNWDYWWQTCHNITATTASQNTVMPPVMSFQFTVPSWEQWNSQWVGIPAGQNSVEYHLSAPSYHETPAAREERIRVAHEDADRRMLARVRANERALGLLMSLLDEEQQATYRNDGYFDVTGSKGGRWRIERRGQAGNVLLLPAAGQDEADMFCIHPPDHLPDADAHMAQMLHLVTDEDSFRRTANRAGRRHLRAVA